MIRWFIFFIFAPKLEEARKHIAILGLMVLLLPPLLQSIHSFEDHHHTVCSSLDEHHFHSQESLCSILHFNIETYSLHFTPVFDIITQDYSKVIYQLEHEFTLHELLKHKTSRAPPTMA